MANVLDEARVQSQQDEGYMQKVFSKYVLSGNEREDDSSQAGSNLLLG
jgi:hypothetical protein